MHQPPGGSCYKSKAEEAVAAILLVGIAIRLPFLAATRGVSEGSYDTGRCFAVTGRWDFQGKST